MQELIIATRESKLALWQSEHIKARLEAAHPGLKVTLLGMTTKGDKILDTPLAKIGGKGLFTKELEEAMARGEAHIAVHSLKDVPTEFEEGFTLAAITEREDPRDAFLSDKYASLEELPQGSVVGTTSMRRKMQLLHMRPDLVIKDLRGNVGTRIQKMKDGLYDAIILATAGMNRLGFGKEVKFAKPLDTDRMIPAMGQGALGIEAIDNPEIVSLVAVLKSDKTTAETIVERAFVERLEGGCQVPIGVFAQRFDDGAVNVRGVVGLPNGKELLFDSLTGNVSEGEALGHRLADQMIEKGAKEILERAYKMC